ncbi:MAG: DUF1194 domain-containing protein [Alphaproteobacteria bacterium]
MAAVESRPVAVELVLAVDVSSSIDRDEYLLQIRGLVRALRSPDVIRAVEMAHGGVAISVMLWAGEKEQQQRIPWMLAREAADLEELAARVAGLNRIRIWGVTAIGEALSKAHRLFGNNGFQGARRVIDVSGDGRSNGGRPLHLARTTALADGVVINGLAVVNDDPDLETYYREELIGGPGAFVMAIADFNDFEQAIRKKLIREIGVVGMVEAVPGR